MNPWLSFLAAFLLALSAGLSPYLPLLLVSAIAGYGGRLALREPFAFIEARWFTILAGLLLLADLFLDKRFVPGDSLATPPRERDRRTWLGALHDLGQMLLGPAGAALLMAATDYLFPPSLPLVAPMLGLLVAALVYTAKRFWRHRYADRWGPFSGILMSTLEDTTAALLGVGGVVLGIMAGR